LRGARIGRMCFEFLNNAFLFVLRQHSWSASFGPNASLRMAFGPEGPDSRANQKSGQA
jgi:hypothetical protein